MKNLIYPIAIFCLFAIFSCSSEKKENANGEKQALKIAVIPKGTTHIYWKSIKKGAEKAAAELGVEILWQGPQKEDDRQMQIQVVQNFVGRNVDGIILAPLDDRSLVPSVKAAISHHIPVVIIDSDLSTKDYSSYVATDNYAGGKLCAKRLAEVTGGKGKLVVMPYSEGSASTIEREKGFMEGIKEYAPGLVILSSNQYAGATMEKALKTSQNLINQYGKEATAYFASNESSSAGMLRALQISGIAGKVKFVGFDVNETLLSALNKGEVDGLAMQNPIHMGYTSVKTIVSVIKKEKFEKKIDTGVKMVTKENVGSPEIKSLLY